MSPTDLASLAALPLDATFVSVNHDSAITGAVTRRVDRRSGREVAVRRFDPTALDRAQHLRRLRGRGVRAIRELLRDDTGPYAVADLGEGVLADRLARGPLPPHELERAAFDLAYGLQTLHGAGFFGTEPTERACALEAAGGVAILALGASLGTESSGHAGELAALDLAAVGRTLLVAAGCDPAAPDAWNEAPESIRPVIRRCVTAGTVAGYDDVSQLLADLGARFADARSAADSERTETLFDTEGGVIDLAESDLPDTRSSPRRLAPDSNPASQPSGTPSRGRTASQSSPSRTRPEAFPWRPVAELYEIGGEAGRGGMGAVQVAVEKVTGRKVAVKRLKDVENLSESALDRFYREAHAIANLSHPHILQLLQPGRDEEGDYLVLEWAAGGSLKDRLVKNGPLPEAEVLAIARKIGQALSYAHTKGVIHRDLKPHNILLTETGEPKLADFGLARSIDDLTLSTSKAGAGSPLYMAPEQHDSSRDADARSDLYSFGKTLYQLATGKLPNQPDPRLLPPSLRAPLLRCMEEERDRRPATVDEFLRDLDRASKPRRSGLAVAASVVVGVAATLLAWRGGWLERGARPNPPVVLDPNPTPSHQASVQPMLASLVALFGPREAQVESGATSANEVSFRVGFEGGDGSPIDPDKLIVERNGQPLAAGQFQITPDGDGFRVVAPLAAGPNAFAVRIGAKATPPQVIERVIPVPKVESIHGGIRVGETIVAAAESLVLDGVVARANGLDSLALERDDGSVVPVPVESSRFRVELPITGSDEAPRTLRWRMPQQLGGEYIDAPAVRYAIDGAAPVIEFAEPVADARIAASGAPLRIRGRVTETHRAAANLELRLLVGDSDRATERGDWSREVALAASNDPRVAWFELEAPLPQDLAATPASILARYTDAAGRTSETRRSFVIDERREPVAATTDPPPPPADLAPPEVAITFQADSEGHTVALALPNEALASLTIAGVAAVAGAENAWSATLPQSLADLRNPSWGPTHDPLTIVAVDLAGNTLNSKVVVAPLHFGRDPFGAVALSLTEGAKFGRYCPRAATHHKESTVRAGVREDFFVDAKSVQCGACGWQP